MEKGDGQGHVRKGERDGGEREKVIEKEVEREGKRERKRDRDKVRVMIV